MSTNSAGATWTGRRRLRISIGVLCLIVAGFALALARVTNEARRQRRAIETIKRLFGTYQFDYEFVGGDPLGAKIPAAKPPGPAWLRRWIGDEPFRDVVEVSLSGPQLRDDDLALLEDLPRLREVRLTFTTDITAAGLAHLRRQRRLRKLSIFAGDNVGDDAMVQLRDLDGLETLYIHESRIGDAGVAHLAGLKSLRSLVMRGSRITDVGAARLGGIKSLRELSLRASQITDAGVEHLLGLEDLRDLDLSASRITNAGLVRLGALPGLARVTVEYTEISKKGIVALKKISPGVVVNTGTDDAGSIDASL